MFIDTRTTPSAATSRRSRRVRPRSCGRAIAHNAAEPNSRRRNTTPGGPSCGKSDFATAAPPCTEHAAASTSPTADVRRSVIGRRALLRRGRLALPEVEPVPLRVAAGGEPAESGDLCLVVGLPDELT